ncbi:ferredoxin [Sorangium sp. So ce1000]|uniref:ferredoxin n=1 Tax=Sorangium sp. So ce1000 TaxID=3133325 RepID=UPI003F625E5E
MANKYRFELNQKECIFCAACASVAPGHFFVDAEKQIAQVSKQPETDEELQACRAAMINCPLNAITEVAVSDAT